MKQVGIYYIATGKHFVAEAEISARQVKKVMPDTPIAISTDVSPEFDFDYVINIPNPAYGFFDQIDNLHRSPFDNTLHFDSDIYVNSDVSEIFTLLNNFDICVAHNHDREAYNVQGVPASFPEFNTGVIAYKNNSKMSEFLKSWKKCYTTLCSEANTQNQPAFRKALYESNLRISPLTPEYNCMIRYPGHVRNEVKIVHSRLMVLETPGSDKIIDVVNSVNTLNKFVGHRLYVPSRDGAAISFGYMSSNPTIYTRFLNSLKARGLKNTLKRSASLVFNLLRG